jgi:hypothetical protein
MSTKSLAEKLLIKPNTTLWSSHPSRLNLIQPLPENLRHEDRLEQATTALIFADDAGSLREILTAHQEQLARPSILWVAYPKGNRADLNRDSLWPILGEYGMRPIGQVSVWTRSGPRCASAPSRKARYPSRAGGSQRPRNDAIAAEGTCRGPTCLELASWQHPCDSHVIRWEDHGPWPDGVPGRVWGGCEGASNGR